MDGVFAYGKPGKRTPLWLSSVIDKEMRYLHEIMQGLQYQKNLQNY